MNHSYYQDYLLVNFKSGQCYNNLMLRRPTIGFISTWPIYQSTTIDRYAHSLIQGISSAATRLDCNLLLGCGSNISGQPANRRSFWPVPGPEVDFLPVGPWNTDGLIVVPDELTQSQIQYIHDLMVSGFPVIFTTPEGPGSLVKVDNQMGIRLAFTHLLEHGHRKIAYIAGHFGRGGDSEERLKAYYSALADAGLPIDERLVAFGEHRKEEGETAMQMIIASGAPFSAVIASNDLSCLGAIEFLSKVGKRIPQDVAVIGFDDILDARSLSPSLTTIRHPTFSLGFQAVQLLMEYIRGERKEVSNVVVPPQLIIRQSCGCRPGQWFEVHTDETTVAMLAHEMAEASLIDARNSLLEDLEEQLISMLNVLVESLKAEQPDKIFEEFTRILAWTEERGEDAHIWLTATSVLMQKINTLIKLVPNADSVQTASLLDRIRLEISDQIQRQTTRSMLGYMDMTAQLGQLTAEMLAAMNIDQSAEILARHLPRVGMKNALVAIYDDKGEEPTSHSTVLFGAGLPTGINGLRFESRKFPFPEIYPEDQAKQLTILPLDVDQKTSGFVAFTAQNPEMCAAIVLNLGASLRTSRLYQDAIEGRRLAEEANRLKSRFLSMVSHELRTPLSLIVGLSEMSLRENKIEVRDVEQINTSAQHLARLIGDVLDLASSEAGQLRILKEPLDLADVLNVPIKIGEQLVKEKGLTWQLNLTAHNLCILGDRTRLRQVTLNLLSNAVKFTEKGRIRMDVAQEGDHVCISISDTGMGIPNTELNTIFNEFYRSERSVESGVSGMGLGLAITRQLVEQHGGTIKVHSPGLMGTGSTFTICIPILDPACLKPNEAGSLMGVNSQVVLLTEENEDFTPLKSFLEEHEYGVTVLQMDDGGLWVRRVVAAAPKALILGQNLAASQGWDIANLLKRSSETDSLLILAYALDKEKNQGELLELNYFHKPLKKEQLKNILPPSNEGSKDTTTVLVVDDDPGILEMHCRMIEGSGRRTLTARNGREALDLLDLTRPDLILLDLSMPVMDGFEMLDLMRRRESLRDIPVIILTARILSNEDLERCNRGVASILGKGLFSASETLNHIESALGRHNTLGGATRQLVRQAMAYIHSHFTESLAREEIAEKIGISPDYLTDCFRQELGITPITYIRRYRVRQACELLRNTNQSITEIAMNVGFSESAHFSHTFLREMGVTPRAYRLNGKE